MGFSAAVEGKLKLKGILFKGRACVPFISFSSCYFPCIEKDSLFTVDSFARLNETFQDVSLRLFRQL